MWGIAIDLQSKVPFNKQITDYLRKQMVSGELAEGTRLPSTRRLADDLQISRNVILDVYDQLTAEGYLVSKRGMGTYVAPGSSLGRCVQTSKESEWTNTVLPAMGVRECIDFRTGVPDVSKFPRKVWGKLAQEVSMTVPAEILGYDQPAGNLELRQVLSHYLHRVRGVVCVPEQILITAGATQAFSLLTQVLLPAMGGQIVTEDPVTGGIQSIFRAAGATLYPVPVDQNGMRTDMLPDESNPAFVFVTPSHQFPLGEIMSIQRRIQLVQYVRAKQTYLVEDDYDSEFRYNGSPIQAMQGLAPDSVIYVGTFSKTISPALRLGFMVLPPSLIQLFQEKKWLIDHHCPSMEQVILAQFIERGHLDKHIHMMKKLYKKRREAIIEALKIAFGHEVTVSGDAAGLHLLVHFHHEQVTDEMIKQMGEVGVKVYPVEEHTIMKGNQTNKIILGYGNLSTEECVEGIHRIKRVIESRKARV